MTLDLQRLNSLPEDEAFREFHSCCGSLRWASQMANGRPFENVDHLKEYARGTWWKLESADWLEAFQSHPKIGEKKAEVPASERAQQWSGQEQSGVRDASQQTIDSLAELNREYEVKFGYIFIVCATGKSSEEMLSVLRERMGNEPAAELRIAASEQAKITDIRLDKMLT
jgi:OHCU decarboxylase